ncbi:hypothetical protein V492_01177 [Pseudogymnoascus sp. VKM F-4246]|nr:hypothetical protein V492_01177 [Pseudogymnoascus sp. VKM F-4246]
MAPAWSLTVVSTIAFNLVQPAFGFWRMSCSVSQMGRIDPVISYGGVSQHVHKISGASNININSTHDSLAAAPSAYWNPQLYYLHSNGQFEEVPNGGMAVYYLGRGMDAAGGTLAAPFPKGLKFLSGNNNARSYDADTMTYGNDKYPSVPVANRVTFACVDYNSPRPETHYMSDTNWYKDDQSHMAYLSGIDNGICPPTHPVLLPVLFIEVPYTVSDINQDGGKFVFANGDETGYGFHGDFINGWDIPTLTSAISECLLANEDGVVEECPPLLVSNDADFAITCPETSPVYSCEPVHNGISQLPGCITPTGLGHVVVPSDNTCPGGNVAACSPNFLNTPPLPFPGNNQYKSLGCYTEPTDARALTGNSYSSTTDMTAEACIEFCAGSKYVAVEYASECYCGSDLNPGSVVAPSTECSMTCPGDRWEYTNSTE